MAETGPDIRLPCPTLSLSHADGDMAGGGRLVTTVTLDGTGPYRGHVICTDGAGITGSISPDGVVSFASTGKDGDLLVATFTVQATDSSAPRRTLNVHRFTVTHAF